MVKLYFRYGAMNSDKSTALLQAAYNYEERERRILLAKPAVDMKGDTTMVSRLGMSRNVDLLVDKKTNPRELLGPLVAEVEAQGEEPIACLLIDEAQLLSPAQADDLLGIAVELTISVIIYRIHTGLSTHSFSGSHRLLEIAHSLEELRTIYRCGGKAIFNGHTIDGAFVFSGEQAAVSGVKVGYETLYSTCHFEAGGLLPYKAERCHGGVH